MLLQRLHKMKRRTGRRRRSARLPLRVSNFSPPLPVVSVLFFFPFLAALLASACVHSCSVNPPCLLGVTASFTPPTPPPPRSPAPARLNPVLVSVMEHIWERLSSVCGRRWKVPHFAPRVGPRTDRRTDGRASSASPLNRLNASLTLLIPLSLFPPS